MQQDCETQQEGKDILEARRLPSPQEDAPSPLLEGQSPFVESKGKKLRLPQVADWQIGESVTSQ